MKKILITILPMLTLVGVAYAAVSPVPLDRQNNNHVEPLIKTDYFKAAYIVASSTVATSTFNGKIAASLGSIQYPAISFIGNDTSGIWQPSTNQIMLSTNGGNGNGIYPSLAKGKGVLIDQYGNLASIGFTAYPPTTYAYSDVQATQFIQVLSDENASANSYAGFNATNDASDGGIGTSFYEFSNDIKSSLTGDMARIESTLNNSSDGTSASNLTFCTSSGSICVKNLVITSSGMVGIGTTTPGSKLTVGSANSLTQFSLFNVASSSASIATSSYLIVGATGSVGMSTSTPVGTLDVKGGIFSENENPATSTSMTVDFSTAGNSQTIKVGTANIALSFTNANKVPGKILMLNVVAPATGVIGSTTPSGGAASGLVIWDNGVNPGNSVVNSSTDVFCFTSMASSTNFIAASLCGTF